MQHLIASQKCHARDVTTKAISLFVDQRSLSCCPVSPGRGMLIELTHSICSGFARLMSAYLKVLHLASIFVAWANASYLVKLAILNVTPQS